MCGAFVIVYKYLVVYVTFCKSLFVCDRVCSMETIVIKHACMLVLVQVFFFLFKRLIPMCPTFPDSPPSVQREVTDMLVDEGLFG